VGGLPAALSGEAASMTINSSAAAEFDYSQPFEVDTGRAAVIAEWLRDNGYPRCTADVVTGELARPGRERSFTGRFAADQPGRAGWRPYTL
jgi:hypothetical protein